MYNSYRPSFAMTSVPSRTLVQPQQAFGVLNLDALKELLSIDFGDHDQILKRNLEAARVQVEKLTGLLLVPGAVTISWRELYDEEDLPYGPVTGVVTATGLDGVTVFNTPPVISGGEFPRLTGDYPAGITLSYSAGYDDQTLPGDLLDSCLALAANKFDGGNRDWKPGALAHRRGSWAL